MSRPYDFYLFDPFDSNQAWLLPQLTARIKLFAAEVARDPCSDLFTRRFIARMVMGDPLVRVYLAVAGEDIVAHTVAEVCNIDGENILFVLQVEVSPGFSSVVDKFEAVADTWCKSMNVKSIRTEIVPSNNDKAWLRLYQKRGWRLVSTVMERQANGQ